MHLPAIKERISAQIRVHPGSGGFRRLWYCAELIIAVSPQHQKESFTA
ncbi:MAG: hypothetical protein WBP54_12485 [Pelodictyon phaeoclathratiforme]